MSSIKYTAPIGDLILCGHHLPEYLSKVYMKLYLRIHHYGLPSSAEPVNKKYTFDVVYYSIFQYGDYPSDYDFSDTSSDSL